VLAAVWTPGQNLRGQLPVSECHAVSDVRMWRAVSRTTDTRCLHLPSQAIINGPAPDAAQRASLTCGQRGQSQTSCHRPRRCAFVALFCFSPSLSPGSTPLSILSDEPPSPQLLLSRISTRERTSRDAVRPLQRPISHRRTLCAGRIPMHCQPTSHLFP